MPELAFSVEGAAFDRFAASPYIDLALRIDCANPETEISNLQLDCQVRIDVARRRYSDAEQARLVELFGEPDRWSRSLQHLLWAHSRAQVPRFRGSTVATLPVACNFDFNVGATKYFHGLEGGEVPLLLLLSGTVFDDTGGALRMTQLPWTAETRCRMPIAVWREMMAHFYPDSAWLRVPHALFDRLGAYKRAHHLATWELALARLLDTELA